MTSPWNAGSHAVQFYDQEASIHHAISEFFTHGTDPGDRLILVSRPRTFTAVAEQLTAGRRGPAIHPADRIQFIDAEAVLPQIMHGNILDQAYAERRFRDVLSQARPHDAYGTIRLYGEIVDVLCQRGDHATALKMEGISNTLLDLEPRLSILCGYALDRFNDKPNAAQLRAVCQKHTHVIPAESFGTTPRIRDYQARMLQHNAFDNVLAKPSPPTGDGTTPARNVYVIDDNATLRRAIGRLLTSSKWPMRTFASAEELVAELDSLSSGCLVVDVQLPGMSGLDLIRHLTGTGLAWPVIVISGLNDTKTEHEALRLGARAFLRKPFNSKALLDAIARAFL